VCSATAASTFTTAATTKPAGNSKKTTKKQRGKDGKGLLTQTYFSSQITSRICKNINLNKFASSAIKLWINLYSFLAGICSAENVQNKYLPRIPNALNAIEN